MATTQYRGHVRNGVIELNEAVELPDGTEVVVSVQPWDQLPVHVREFLSLPAIGMWKDREDMADSAAWVAEQRAKWRERLNRQPD